MEFWTVFIAIISSGAFASIVTAIVNAINKRMEEKNKKKSVQNRALSMLLLRDIQEFSGDLLKEDEISADEYKQIEESYEIYKELGGNGFVDKIYKEVSAMPLKK